MYSYHYPWIAFTHSLHQCFTYTDNVVATGGNTANGLGNNVYTGGNGINAWGYGDNAVLSGGNAANGIGNNIGTGGTQINSGEIKQLFTCVYHFTALQLSPFSRWLLYTTNTIQHDYTHQSANCDRL